jgi:hypothetical protein
MVQTIVSKTYGYVLRQPLETIKHNFQTSILSQGIGSKTITTDFIS